jgi:hypothetical protein
VILPLYDIPFLLQQGESNAFYTEVERGSHSARENEDKDTAFSVSRASVSDKTESVIKEAVAFCSTVMRTPDEKPYKCDDCGKGFSKSCLLQKHRKIHIDDKPYKCDVCEKAFNHSGSLKMHMRMHTGEKPCICDVCGKAFVHTGNLQRHRRTHTGKKAL